MTDHSHLRLTRRQFTGQLLGAALACGACRRAPRGSTLTVLSPGDERSWALFVPSQFLVFLPLARRNRLGQLEGWLARAWSYAADFRTCVVKLRQGVRSNDGAPVTAEDVKFSSNCSPPRSWAWSLPDWRFA